MLGGRGLRGVKRPTFLRQKLQRRFSSTRHMKWHDMILICAGRRRRVVTEAELQLAVDCSPSWMFIDCFVFCNTNTLYILSQRYWTRRKDLSFAYIDLFDNPFSYTWQQCVILVGTSVPTKMMMVLQSPLDLPPLTSVDSHFRPILIDFWEPQARDMTSMRKQVEWHISLLNLTVGESQFIN